MKTLEVNRLRLVGFILVSLVLSACKGKWDGDVWVREADALRDKVLKVLPLAPYKTDEQEALKAYFEKPEGLLQVFAEEPKAVAAFNAYLAKQDMDQVCSKALLQSQDWQIATGHCAKNRYFLCAEAVRRYPDNVKRLRAVLTSENGKRFDESGSCRRTLFD